MTPCDCHHPARPASHRLRSGRFVCAKTAARVTSLIAAEIKRRTPEPLPPEPAPSAPLFPQETP